MLALEEFRLERQQGKHVIDGSGDRRRPARAPCPEGGGNIVNDGHGRPGPLDPPRRSQAEVRAVYRHHRVGPAFQGRALGQAQKTQQAGQFRHDLGKPHDGKFRVVEQAGQAARFHLRAADPDELGPAVDFRDPRHQGCAKPVARRLPGHEEDPRRQPDSSGTPQMKSP